MSKCSSNWHCCCHRQQRDSRTCNQHRQPVESSTEEDEYPEFRCSYQYPKRGSSNVNCGVHNNNSVLDQQTWQDLSSLRQKACRFIRSDSEWTSSSESLYPNDTYRRSDNLVRKASDLIDYEPKSSFLKKIKEQCQCWQNTHPVQNILSNYNEASDFDPVKCQQYKSRSGQILKLGEQYKSGKSAPWAEESSRTNKPCKCCCPGEPSRASGLDFNRNVCKSAGNEYNVNQATPRQYRIETRSQEKRGNEQCGDAERAKKPEKKSEHVSRSKKTVKTRGRKKRKSNSEEKSESEGTVESTLKKPHQNSCERCWRYASPARSPVNKPEQRYDPNFRKAHSCTDFEYERGDLNLEVPGRHVSPCKNLQPVVNKNFVPLPTTQSIQKKPSSTKVKELTFDGPHGREPERNAHLAEDGRKPDSRSRALVCADSGQRPRPKSCTTDQGASSRGFVGNFTNFIDDLDVTEYKEIHIRPRKPSYEAPDCNRFGRNADFNRIPTCGQNAFSSSSRTNEQFNSRSKFEGDCRSPRENESSATTRSSKNNRRSDRSPQAQNHSSPKWESTVYEDLLPPKTSRTPSPKMSSARSKKSSSPKGSPNKERETKSAKSSRNRPSENLPPARTQSSLAFQENCPQHRGATGQSSRYNGNPAARQWNQALDCGIASNMWSGPPHAIRKCTCYPRVRRYRAEENLFQDGGNEGHVYCCHCNRQEENSRNQPSIYSQGASRGSQRNEAPCERLHGKVSPERHFGNEVANKPDGCGCDRSHRNGPPDKAFAPTARERMAPCPYREAPGERVPLRSHNLSENARCCPKGVGKGSVERDAPAERRHAPRCPHSSYSPTKYCVFYMTKSKDEEKGNEVEVLVEELTQKNSGKKDAKAKDLGEKVKKILECPTDSMALRFQKGVSDSCKNVESSRILYF